MKRLFHHIYLLLAVMLMAACANDNDAEPATVGDEGFVTLRITANTAAVTRARTTNWSDANAEDEEMMNLWVVVVTNTSDGSVYKCFACRPAATGTEREIDDVGRIIKGDYTVYSFANISVANVCNLLGLTLVSVPNPITSTPVEFTVSGSVNHATVAAATATVNGNNFNATAADNGFGETGIPMSNKQTIAATESSKDLIVVRMLAKMKISVKNETGSAVTIKYATISNVTSNTENNLKLLPNWTSSTGKDNMDVVQHGDLQPNLNGTPTTTEVTIPNMALETALNNGATREVTFYINECKKPSEFYITIGLGDANSTNEYRYALIDSKGNTTDDDNKWNYIARNDYRIIPIILDDYKLELIPYDFPPIGVYPVSVSEIDNVNHVYNFTFHDYGHFHLLPRVTKTSNNNSPVAYSATTPSSTTTAWTLNTDWAATLKTAAFKGGAWLSSEQVVANGFYRNQTDVADADEAGGVPVWYANDGTAGPQWDPSASANYVPFIFGYIAEPATLPLTVDRKMYHEVRVKLYVDGEYRRDLIYRYYMTLSMDQMLSPSAARRSHDL